MGFYNKYEDKPTLDVNGAILEVHNGCLSCKALPPAVRGFKLVDVIPKVKGTTTILQSLSDLVDKAYQGTINYRFVTGLELSCNLIFEQNGQPLQIAIFAAEGHRAKISVNGNTNYTVTTVAQYLDAYAKQLKPEDSNKYMKLLERLDNLGIKGTCWDCEKNIFSIVESSVKSSFGGPWQARYGLDCFVRATKEGNAEIVKIEYDEGYFGTTCIYNNTKMQVQPLSYAYSDTKYKDILHKIATPHMTTCVINTSYLKVWNTLKAMPGYKLNGNTLRLGVFNGNAIEARYKDDPLKSSPYTDDILIKQPTGKVISVRDTLNSLPPECRRENGVISFIKYITLTHLYPQKG